MKKFIKLSIIIAITTAVKVPEQREITNQSKRSFQEPEPQGTSFYQSPYYFPQSHYRNDQSQHFDEDETMYQGEYEKQSDDKAAKLLNYHHVYDQDSYKYEYESDNGIKTQEEGHKQGKNLEVQGSYSFTADDGKTYSVAYVADEHGFRAVGDHIPTPPPIPDDIAKSIEQNAEDEAQGLIEEGSYKKEYENEDSGENNFGEEFNHYKPELSTFKQYQEASKQIKSAMPTQFSSKYPTKSYIEPQKPKVHYTSYEAPKKQEYKTIVNKKPKHYEIKLQKQNKIEPSHHQVTNSHIAYQPTQGFEKFEHKIPEFKSEHHIPTQTFEFVPSDAKYHGHTFVHSGYSEPQFEHHELGLNQDQHGLEQYTSFEDFKPFEHYTIKKYHHIQEPHPVYESESQDDQPSYHGYASENKPVTYRERIVHRQEHKAPTVYEAQTSHHDLPTTQTVDYYPEVHQAETNQHNAYKPQPSTHKQSNKKPTHQQRINLEQTHQQPIKYERIDQQQLTHQQNSHPVQYHTITVPISHVLPEQRITDHAYEASQHQPVVSQKAPVPTVTRSKIRSQDNHGHKAYMQRHESLAYEASQNVPVVTPKKPAPVLQRNTANAHKSAQIFRNKGKLVKVIKRTTS